MTTHYSESNRKNWETAGLLDYADYAECVEYYNQQEDYCDSLAGLWYFCDDDNMTIYGGSFSNSHSPGASHFVWADVYDCPVEYRSDSRQLLDKPEYLENDDDDDDEDEDEDDM